MLLPVYLELIVLVIVEVDTTPTMEFVLAVLQDVPTALVDQSEDALPAQPDTTC